MEFVRCKKCQETLGECRCPNQDTVVETVETAQDWLRHRRLKDQEERTRREAKANDLVRVFLDFIRGGKDIWVHSTVTKIAEDTDEVVLGMALDKLVKRGFEGEVLQNNDRSIDPRYSLVIRRPEGK